MTQKSQSRRVRVPSLTLRELRERVATTPMSPINVELVLTAAAEPEILSDRAKLELNELIQQNPVVGIEIERMKTVKV